MRWGLTLLFLVGTLPLLGSECSQQLFAPISCDSDAECLSACEEFCFAAGDEVESAECDANGFCDCLCMEPGSGGPGGSGGEGSGGMGGEGSGGSAGSGG